jgi:peptide/nickel transport system substrate-binding protein/oligopeptide transport system substrate-binding protein
MKRPLALVVFALVILAAFLALTLGRKRPPAGGNGSVEGGVLRLPLPKNPKTLDPAGITDVYSDAMAQRIYNCLVKHSPQLEVVPDLAESWTVSEDGRTYTFKLRSGVKFHHGRELVADDVVFSLSRLADPRCSRKRELVEDIEGAAEYGAVLERVMKGEKVPTPELPAKPAGLSAPDAHTVVIRLRRRWPIFLHLLAMSPCSIVPRDEMLRLGADFPLKPVGTGPFKVAEVGLDNRIEMVRFDDHFAGRPRLAGLSYQVIEDRLVRFDKYRSGELDMTDVPLGKFKSVENHPDLHRWTQLNIFYLGIAMTKKPLGENVHLRRALNYAINRERLCNDVLEGRAVPARGILPPGLPGYSEKLKGYSYDPEAARRELAAAGHPEGRGLSGIKLCFDPRNDGKLIAVEIQKQLKAAKIPVELYETDFNTLLDLTRNDPPPLYRLAWIADYPDPDNFLYVLFHSSRAGQSNRVHYKNPEVDRILDAARALPMGAERSAAYSRAEAEIVEDAPWVFLYHRAGSLLVNPRVKGVTFTPLDSGVELPQADFINIEKE